jgi:TetR/AcrR family transcriptional repressor of mexCD-oprJ operon
MGEVAGEAGVSRATLYRYFPRREDLLQALLDAAIDDAHQRMLEAALDEVEVPEAVARMARALVTSGTRYAVVFVEGASIDPKEVELRIGTVMQAVFRRGVAEGVLRQDLSPETLLHLFGGLLKAAVRMTTVEGFGVERAAAAITSVFLDGARTPR